MSYRLTPRAVADLEDIWRYSADTWSAARADRYLDEIVQVFEMIAALPTLAPEFPVFTPPVRIHPHERHLIVYSIGEDHVAIVRVLGGQQDWVAILRAAEG